jgi:hypothetical protein
MDVAVLKCCPDVETLIKPPMPDRDGEGPNASFPFPDRTITTFKSVQRIEWSFLCPHSPNPRLVDESQSFFWHLVQITPDHRYLSLTGSTYFPYHPNPALFSDLDSYLLRLQVLRFENVYPTIPREIREWNLTALTHLVTDDVDLCGVLRPLVVELVSMTTPNAVDRVLQLCPQLQELSYDITLAPPTRPIAENAHLESSIQCIRLRITDYESIIGVVTHLGRHFTALSGPQFPLLRRFVLHYPWPIPQAWVELLEYTAHWETALRARGCTLEWVPMG